MRKTLIQLMLVILFVPLLMIRAQEPDAWTAILYDSFTGGMLQVAPDGTTNVLTPLPTATVNDVPVLPGEIAVSPDGEIAAYVSYATPPVFMITNRSTNETVTHPLPPEMTNHSLSFVASSAIFSPDGTRLAFGYAVADGAWSVTVYEQASEWAAVSSLSYTSFSELSRTPGRTPIVTGFSADGVVTVALAEAFSGYAANFELGYRWNPDANTLTRLSYPLTVDGDTRGGARLMPLFDADYPNSANAFTYPQANTLYQVNPDGTRDLLFNTANLSLFFPRYIAGGRVVLVGGYSSQNRLTWFLFDAVNGTPLGEFPPVQIDSVLGTPDGFVYVVNTGAEGAQLYHVVLRADNTFSDPVLLWSGSGDTRYRLAWVG